MEEEEYMEFSIAHRRKYSLDHLWFQEKDDRQTIGISDYFGKDIGEILRVILPHADDEIDEDEELFSLWTAEEKYSFRAPFGGVVHEVIGEVEKNPDLVNDSPYDQGWLLIFGAYEMNSENLLEPDEYVETLAEV